MCFMAGGIQTHGGSHKAALKGFLSLRNMVSLCFEFPLKDIFVQKSSMAWLFAQLAGMSGRQVAKAGTVELCGGVSVSRQKDLPPTTGPFWGPDDWVKCTVNHDRTN